MVTEPEEEAEDEDAEVEPWEDSEVFEATRLDRFFPLEQSKGRLCFLGGLNDDKAMLRWTECILIFWDTPDLSRFGGAPWNKGGVRVLMICPSFSGLRFV